MGCYNSKTDFTPRRKKKSRGGVNKIKEKYMISNKVLGSGGFGKVFQASLMSDPDYKVAIKVISKMKVKDDLDEIFDEIEVLSNLDHPHIVKYIETFENSKFLYIVMELCDGGELFEMIHKKVSDNGTFAESEAASIMKSLLKAVTHCHSYKIAHRDIKPENVMVGGDGQVKLIDFGLSKQVKAKAMKSIVGSPYYVAPEVLDEKYGLECDIWSLGVILYIMLSGYLPFGGDNPGEVFEKIKKGEYSFKQKEWNKVSEEGKDLITHMLELNTKKRHTAPQCLKHDWFKVAEELKEDAEKDALDIDLLHNLKEYKSQSMLKKAALSVLVKTLTAKEIKHLKRAFEAIDTDHTGYIDSEELSEAMKKSNFNLPAKEIDQIISEIDYKGNNQINYSEFIAATIRTKRILNDSKMMVLFKEFDTDDSGYITKENLVEAFDKFDKNVSRKEIDEIIAKHDLAKDGQISFQEFKIMMLGEDEVVDTFTDNATDYDQD